MMKDHKQRLKAIWDHFRSASLPSRCDLLAFLFVCAFFFDCSFSGGGRYISIGPLSPRMIFAFLAFALSLPRFLKNFRKYITNPVLLAFAAFIVYLLICAVRGYLANNRWNVLISDVKGFAWLFLVPVLVVTVYTKTRFEKVLTSIMSGAVVQASLVLVINCVCSSIDKGIMLLYHPMFQMQFGTVSIISERIYRIFMNSCPYMVFACAIAVFRQVRSKKIMLRYVAVIVFCLCGILLSFTRSAYGCAFVVAGCAIVAIILLYRKGVIRHMGFLAISLAASFVLVFCLEFIFEANYFNFALSRTLGVAPRPSVAASVRYEIENYDWKSLFKPQDATDSTDPSSTEPSATDPSLLENTKLNDKEQEMNEQKWYMNVTMQSDQLRAVTQAELIALIRQNPMFGNGLGASAPSRDTGLDEYFYLDVLARMGIVGLVLYLLPFALTCIISLKNLKGLVSMHGAVAALCGMIGFWAISWFNPWMNAALGIASYALCSAIPNVIKAEE